MIDEEGGAGAPCERATTMRCGKAGKDKRCTKRSGSPLPHEDPPGCLSSSRARLVSPQSAPWSHVAGLPRLGPAQ